MELQLKNIGMIKEANVKIDGLTVIAGENDTGKSTAGKALYLMLKSASSKKEDYIEFHFLVQNIFNSKLSNHLGNIKLVVDEETEYNAEIYPPFGSEIDFINREHYNHNCIFIETPIVWSFTDFFRDIAQVESQMEIKLDYPYLMKDLNFKLHIKSALDGLDIKEKVTSLMGGEFKKDEMGRYYFDKQGQRIELVNTATGIKYFGIFQVLSQNNYLNENTVLVLDEPEVHLHPKWQLEMAKIIVELVKNGVKIVVNSHSPYMIDALKYYADKFKVNNDFYLAEKNGDETSTIRNVTFDISPIFEKLTEPLERLHKMKLGLVDDN